MRTTDSMRIATLSLVAGLGVLMVQSCGGGGGGSTQGGQPGQLNTSTPRRTGTPTPTRTGSQPTQAGTATPRRTGTQAPGVPTPTPVQLTIVFPGENIAAAAKLAPPNSLVVLSPGVYAPFALGPDDQLQGPIAIVADVTGTLTGGISQPITINASTGATGIEITDQSDITLDGFLIRGGTEAGINIVNSTGITVQNCVITSSKSNTRDGGDGVRFEDSFDGRVFDNAISNRAAAGIHVIGTAGMEVINNTLYANASGLSVGTAGQPSSDVLAENNIFNKNQLGIAITSESSLGFETNFNMNTDGYQGTEPGESDFSNPDLDPFFILPRQGDFHLAQGSLAIDSGDDSISEDFIAVLSSRTTQLDGTLDCAGNGCGSVPGFVDLGFHYPPVRTPTPR